MSRFTYFLTVLMMSIVMAACSNHDEPTMHDTTVDGLQIVSISDYLDTKTRTGIAESTTDPYVLKFKDQESYDKTLELLRRMNDEQRKAFFDQIGFEGAYMIQEKANAELDEIFDLESELDSIKGAQLIMEFKKKYESIMEFNRYDQYDCTPDLKFIGEEAELLGNKDGYIIVEDKVITPSPNKAPYAGQFVPFKCDVVAKDGNYRSYFTLGLIGENLAFKLETYKKSWVIFKKHDRKCKYFGTFKIWSNGLQASYILDNANHGEYKLSQLARFYSPRINLEMKNFYSTRNPNKKTNKTNTNVLVKSIQY